MNILCTLSLTSILVILGISFCGTHTYNPFLLVITIMQWNKQKQRQQQTVTAKAHLGRKTTSWWKSCSGCAPLPWHSHRRLRRTLRLVQGWAHTFVSFFSFTGTFFREFGGAVVANCLIFQERRFSQDSFQLVDVLTINSQSYMYILWSHLLLRMVFLRTATNAHFRQSATEHQQRARRNARITDGAFSGNQNADIPPHLDMADQTNVVLRTKTGSIFWILFCSSELSLSLSLISHLIVVLLLVKLFYFNKLFPNFPNSIQKHNATTTKKNTVGEWGHFSAQFWAQRRAQLHGGFDLALRLPRHSGVNICVLY